METSWRFGSPPNYPLGLELSSHRPLLGQRRLLPRVAGPDFPILLLYQGDLPCKTPPSPGRVATLPGTCPRIPSAGSADVHNAGITGQASNAAGASPKPAGALR